jgi:hypothetical protein
MTDADSFLKARYAIALLGTARESDRWTAVKLVEALALEFPSPRTGAVADAAHKAALVKFYELAEALRSGRDPAQQWTAAEMAARRWMDLLQGH